MNSSQNFNRTKTACYFGFITQAICANFTPLLFLTFNEIYEIPLGKIAMIPTCFFLTQLFTDFFCAKFADKIGYRICIIVAEISSFLGLIFLTILPEVLDSHFAGILISVIIYAFGCGLIEVLCSPIIEACPFKNKESTMSLLHSFYCWGSAFTILISSLLFYFLGIQNWKIVAWIWAIIPAVNIFNFIICPIVPLTKEGESSKMSELCKNPLFWICFILMACSGACELSMSQWASSYAESALKLSKTSGDLSGPCLFAIMMGFSRMIFGKFGEKMNLLKFMIFSGILCLVCYLMVCFSENSLAGLLGCVLCGFSVGIMWPGTLSISSKKITNGGTALFALLALAGDLGGSIGPFIVGNVAQKNGNNIQIGMCSGLIFPVLLILGLLIISRQKSENK